MTYELFVGDCLETMKGLPSASVHCCVTSPPYYMLRDYDNDGQIGLEPTPALYVERLVEVFRELRRILRDDGVFWLNIGDSYAGGGAGARDPEKWPKQSQNYHRLTHAKRNTGLKNGDLIGVPWMLAFALRADGWYLRQDVIWDKPNPMPESVKNRCTKSHEYLFMFSKSAKYYFDGEAIKEPAVSTKAFKFTDNGADKQRGHGRRHEGFNGRYAERIAEEGTPTTRNRRSVWKIATKPYRGAHFATFPEELITPCILAGVPEKCCSDCGQPWQRKVHKVVLFAGGSGRLGRSAEDANASGKWVGRQYGMNIKLGPQTSTTTTGWRPQCDCMAEPMGGVVIDPFGGSGTTAAVAIKTGRRAILCELNPGYAGFVESRVRKIAGKELARRAEIERIS